MSDKRELLLRVTNVDAGVITVESIDREGQTTPQVSYMAENKIIRWGIDDSDVLIVHVRKDAEIRLV